MSLVSLGSTEAASIPSALVVQIKSGVALREATKEVARVVEEMSSRGRSSNELS